MRQTNSLNPYGIVRTIDSRNWMREGTYKAGQRHGLHRKVTDQNITIEFYVAGEIKASFAFLSNFRETFRDDKQNHLGQLIGSDFDPRLI